MENSNKKSLKWLWIAIAIAVVVAVGVWCGVMASNADGITSIFGVKLTEESINKFRNGFVLFTLAFLILAFGYLFGCITIKGISLGTAGVFLVAILFGWLCTLDFTSVPVLKYFHMQGTTDTVVKYLKGPVQNLGLILFVGSVGFIAGPNFFKNLNQPAHQTKQSQLSLSTSPINYLPLNEPSKN